MQNRIAEIIKKEGLTSQQFAAKMNMQSSTISHILTGRNMPSYKFIYSVLDTFKEINPDWFIFGKGEMLRSVPENNENNNNIISNIENADNENNYENDADNDDDNIIDLSIMSEGYGLNKNFSEEDVIIKDKNKISTNELGDNFNYEPLSNSKNQDSESKKSIDNIDIISSLLSSKKDVKIEKILIMYSDNTFEVFNAR